MKLWEDSIGVCKFAMDRISERMLSVPSGPAKATAAPLGPYLKAWREEYHRVAGWTIEHGRPLPDTLERVGLSGFKVGR